MAYGDVKEHFSKGELNDLWNFIEFVGEIFPSKRDNIEKLKNSFIDMDAKRFIVSFDSERADVLLFPKD